METECQQYKQKLTYTLATRKYELPKPQLICVQVYRYTNDPYFSV